MAETAAGFGARQRIEPDGNAGVPRTNTPPPQQQNKANVSFLFWNTDLCNTI